MVRMNQLAWIAKMVVLSGVLASVLMFLWARSAHAASPSQWESILAAAEKEGTVAVYAAGYPHVMEEFQRAYPKIKLAVSGAPRGVDLLNRLMAERRAGKFVADIYSTGLGTHLQLYMPRRWRPCLRRSFSLR
jgi:hypothetical protein